MCSVNTVREDSLSFWMKLPSWWRSQCSPPLLWLKAEKELIRVGNIFEAFLSFWGFWVVRAVFIFSWQFLPYCSILYVWVIKSLYLLRFAHPLSKQCLIYACPLQLSSILQHKSRPYCARGGKFFAFSSNQHDIFFHKIWSVPPILPTHPCPQLLRTFSLAHSLLLTHSPMEKLNK